MDTELEVFDVIMETKYGTTYNSYIVRTTHGFVLIETVKEKYFDSYLAKIKKIVGDLIQVRYLISNHTEPDHAGSIQKILEIMPHISLVASKTALGYLKNITNISNISFRQTSAEELGSLVVGDKEFEFISVPFLHWPDSMYSYLRKEKVLFTCDSFGSHYSPLHDIRISKMTPDEEEKYQDALFFYYTCIFGPFKKYVIRGLEKIKDLTIELVCNGHGPVLDSRINEILGKYRAWSTVPAKLEVSSKTIVIPYCTAYGYTKEIETAIESGIKSYDPKIKIISQMIDVENFEDLKPELIEAMAGADGVLLGTNTINGDAIPFIWELALSIGPITHAGKVVSAFGSYGWSGEGVDNIIDKLKQARLKVMEGFKVQFRPSQSELELANEFGERFAEAVVTDSVPPLKTDKVTKINYNELNPSGKVVLWRCIICGEVFPGVVPPEVCPTCGVSQELFELYVPEKAAIESFSRENFIIIGSSAAGVSAAKAIRDRAKEANITIISSDSDFPYHIPILPETMTKDVSDEDFYINPKEFYEEQRIELKLRSKVTKINHRYRKVILSDGEQISYDKLIIANGSTNILPDIPGTKLTGVFTVKYKNEITELKNYAEGKSRAVVIGAGLLGLEIADALSQKGLKITVLEIRQMIMPHQLYPQASDFFASIVAKAEIQLVLGAEVESINGEDDVAKSVSASGISYEADLVVVCCGVKANIELAAEVGLKVNRGVVVNELMETSKTGIYAAGDVAELDNICYKKWNPAVEQGKVAGANAVGDNVTYTHQIESFQLTVFGSELLCIGNPPIDPKTARICTYEDESENQFAAVAFRNDKLIYGVVFNLPDKFPEIIAGVKGGYPSSIVLPRFFE